MLNWNGKKPYKPKIRIDNSGASEWVNIAEYFMSDEGQEFLKKSNEFAKRHIKKTRMDKLNYDK
jgi:hypothetical protein